MFLLAWESLVPFFTYFSGNTPERVRHGLKNLVLGVLNSAAHWPGIRGVVVDDRAVGRSTQFGVLNWLPLPAWARLAAAFLLFDAWMYWWHRLNHRVPFLWRFHRTHHSDPKMDVTTASRFHIGEIAFSSVLRVPVIALLGPRTLGTGALRTGDVHGRAVSPRQHRACQRRLDQVLRAFIVTPFMHKVHHSRWQPETDSNYSSLFSFWDRLFRTFRLRDDPGTLRFGLDEFDRPEDHTLIGLLATPFKRVKRMDQPSQFGEQPFGGRGRINVVSRVIPNGKSQMGSHLTQMGSHLVTSPHLNN